MRLPNGDQVIITHGDRMHRRFGSTRRVRVRILPGTAQRVETRMASFEVDTGVRWREVQVDQRSATVAVTLPSRRLRAYRLDVRNPSIQVLSA